MKPDLTPPTAAASPLLALPAELRNRVFEFYFATDIGIAPPSMLRSPLAISLTCHSLYEETHALAFPATTFRLREWSIAEVQIKLQRVRPELHPQIRKLELDFNMFPPAGQRHSAPGLQFAKVGLNCLEELYIKCTAATQRSQFLPRLAFLIYQIVARNEQLRKICVLHGGRLSCDVVDLHDQMVDIRPVPRKLAVDNLRLSTLELSGKTWAIQPHFENGKRHCSLRLLDQANQRAISITMGHTVREAELWHLVRQELLEGKILSNVTARLPEGVDAADLDPDKLVYEIDQLSFDFKLSTPLDTDAYY
ncbi:hypothetical protein K504DRAFT_461906 [Pleomassaria siparia CBS 279.74]|uniref:Uncharacterized protein n=1 Tax=Pleomassaria siparia CBS 279.74 TaxID=1314801 RepID=A0A6G1KKP7_9PLEO|nr:hypothetical protein K504DRAFT_461906 [Pleomassaria siparia CBS 279.74]